MNSQELRALQEAYMEVYMDEGWKPLPTEKMKERQQRYQSRYSSPFGSGHLLSQPMDKRISDYKKSVKIGDVLSKSTTTRNPKKLKKQTAMGDFLPGGRVHSKNAKQKEVKEDLYDIILSHLLDEGYAETQEQAEVIMVNMSEDWRESIMEGMKPLPVGKMAKQADRKAFHHNLDYEPWSYYTNTNRQLRKMSEVGGKKVKKAAEKGRELANDVDNRLYRKYAPPDLHR